MNLLDIDVSRYDTLFLDRDGVINKLRQNDYVKCWDEFEFLPGVFEALAKWKDHFKHIIIVTNQRGIGKGLMTDEDLNSIHQQMINEIEPHSGRIDKIYYCSSLTEEDFNRKPGIGMFQQAVNDFGDIIPETSLMIGDSESDMEFAENCGMMGIKI